MAKKKNNDYFKLIEQQLEHASSASEYLCEVFNNFTPASVEEYKIKMHSIEHNADEVHHDILTRLMIEFMTPIDQEDILRLVQINDDITDAIDEVIMDLYMYCVDALPEGAASLAQEVNNCVKALNLAATELRNFKKPQKLREYLIQVNDIESKADEIYFEAIRKLFTVKGDAAALFASRAIFESLENCCDLCEHASDVIEQIIIKNT